MKYLAQNESGLYIDIQKIGCFFRSALHIGELITGRVLTVEQINRMWDKARSLKFIDDKLCVKDSASIANLVLSEFGVAGKVIEVYTKSLGQEWWYGSKDRRVDYYIKKIAQNGPSKTHFVNCDETETVTWDPHDPEIKSQGTIKLIGYQYREV